MFDLMQLYTTTMERFAQYEHGSVAFVFLIGILFGVIIQLTRLDTFEKIAGFAMLRDFNVPKMMFLTIGLTSMGLYFMIQFGYAEYHAKPVLIGGLIVGGLIFGVGMAIFGLCPGTGPMALAEGKIDVLVGIIGGLVAGGLFTWMYGDIKGLLGPDFGKVTLDTIAGESGSFWIFVYGIGISIVAFLLPDKTVTYSEETLAQAERESNAFERFVQSMRMVLTNPPLLRKVPLWMRSSWQKR